MTNTGYKTPKIFKFRVRGDQSSPDRPQLAVVDDSSAVAAPDQLLAVLSDPNAHENDWLNACQQLDEHNRKIEREALEAKKRRRLTWVISSIVLLGTGFGAAAFIQLHSVSAQPKPIAAPLPDNSVDFGPYMATLQRQIKAHWHPPQSNDSHHITMRFRVAKSGEISDVAFDRLSRESEADAAALKSIVETMRTAPPLPAGAPSYVDVQFTFDYLVSD
jgi:hypothetical protein